jgi:hypothetical protein
MKVRSIILSKLNIKKPEGRFYFFTHSLDPLTLVSRFYFSTPRPLPPSPPTTPSLTPTHSHTQ